MTHVAVAVATATKAPATSSGLLLQRKCACAEQGPQCEECGKDKLQRKALGGFDPRHAPPIVNKVLRAPGQPLREPTRSFMEERFAHSFGNVRIHVDAEAARSARAVGAAAYTVGRNVVFDSGRYTPDTASGRRLLAHELTHVVQQRGATMGIGRGLPIDSAHSAGEAEAERISAAIDLKPFRSGANSARLRQPTAIVSRLNAKEPDAVALTMNLGRTPHTGLQFVPSDVRDTRVGPVRIQGGLLSGSASRLNVIIGENLTLHSLAVELLPLWTTATPFTPAGAATPLPLDPVTADQLGRALLVYNRTYLGVPDATPPAMTRWRAGQRLPLPVEIDETTHVATLNPRDIIGLAGTFDPGWAPLLEQRATAPGAPSAALVMLEVDAFLREHTDATDRGVTLGARALTNATAELPFIREVFRQLGATDAVNVAIAFLQKYSNPEFQLLAAQRDGNAILTLFETPLNSKFAHLTDDQDQRLFGMSIAILNTPALAPPDALRNRTEKTVTIDTVKLEGSNRDPAAEVATANAIFASCNVRFVHGVKEVATPDETTAWIGARGSVHAGFCSSAGAQQLRLIKGARTRFSLTGRIQAFYVPALGSRNRAESCPPSISIPLLSRVAWVSNDAMGRTLAHEIGHILSDPGPHKQDKTNLMTPTSKAPIGETIDDQQCNRIYSHA